MAGTRGQQLSDESGNTSGRLKNRARLAAFLRELEEELGPPTEAELAWAAAAFDAADAPKRRAVRP